MLKPSITTITLLLIIVFFHMEAQAMFSLGVKLHLFSAVEGRVLNGKAPVVNAVVRRTYKWRGESVTDKQVTDSQGGLFP